MTYHKTTAKQRKAEQRANVKYFHVSKEWIDNPLIEVITQTILHDGGSIMDAANYIASMGIPDKVLSKGLTYTRKEDNIARRDVRKALGLSHRQIRKQRNKARGN